jgi:voltage-gated potassium channel
MLTSSHGIGRFRTGLRRLFYGHRPAAVAFQAGLLTLDLAAIAYFLTTTFVADAPWIHAVDLLLGTLLTLEFLGRMLAHRHPMHYLDNAAALVDLVVIASLFLSVLVGNLAFLRVVRTVRLVQSYNVLGRLKKLFPAVRRNEEVITAALDLAVFMLIVASVVYATQRAVNPEIGNFLDALYFTVTTLSTTGFGDITL